MHANPVSLQPPRLFDSLAHWIVGFVAAVMLAFVAVTAHAAPPPAGTSISNQASASYSDGATTRNVTSNVVQTTVLQVASLTLTANGAQNATAGSVVYYPHTLTNTGNGSDTFNLSAASSTGASPNFVMGSIQIFADNGSGQPTGAAITSTGALTAGGVFKFIVTGTVPAGAAATNTNTTTVTAASTTGTTPPTASNTDVTTVTANAVISVTKAVSVGSGAPGSALTYTLTYTNTGNSTASTVALTDVLNSSLTFTPSSARWSVTGNAAVLPMGTTPTSSGTAPNTISTSLNGNTAVFTVNQVAPGVSGTITFGVTVNAATPPGVIPNTVTTSYNNGAATVTGSSNVVNFTVTQTAAVTLTPPAADTVPAAPGSTRSFTNVVTNNGTGTDTFNIVVGTSSFPSGTTFQLFKSDGATPLVDTNGDGTVDTGPLAAGASYNVILKATLPSNAISGGPYSVAKTATSVLDPTKSSTGTDTLNTVTAASVDITNNAIIGGAGVSGVGAGPEGTAVVVKTANPSTSTTFVLAANNTGLAADSYNLGVSTNAGFTGALPAGWTVTFKADGGSGAACSTTGATITNTGSVPVTGTKAVIVCAVVTVPAGALAATTDLYFRVQSPTSGAQDIVHDALTINAVRSLTVTPNGTGQTFPGGSYVYTHTLTNTGNVTEGGGASNSVISLATSGNQSGWTSTLYYDANNDGTLDASDPAIAGGINAIAALSAGLAPGASIRIFDKVISPSGAAIGAVNATVITATVTNGASVPTNYGTAPAGATATDTTTVIAGNLTLVKQQALDGACNGTPTSSYSTGAVSALPGACLLYQITVSNVGTASATTVTVTDSTPSYTTLSVAPSTTAGTIAAGAPAVNGTGTITANVGTLAAGASATLTFGVKINN